jgi:PilZ domain
MDRWNEVRDVGSTPKTGNVDYFRALKRTLEKDSASTAQQPGDKRRSPRFKCAGSVEFRCQGSTVRTWATVTDLSRNGCYAEMQATSPVDTPLDMIVDVMDTRVQVKGIVRVSYPFLGMGIAFTEISDAERQQLDEILLRLAGGTPVPASPIVKPVRFDVASIKDPQAALKALEVYFQEHSILSREHFDELVKTNGSR